MKILQLTNKIPYPPKDGGARATLNLSLGFAKLGHDVTILGMNTSKHFIGIDALPEEITRNVKFHAVYVNTKLCLWDALTNLLFSKLPYNATRFISDNYSNKLKELLQSEKFDIIQLEGLYLTFYIDLIKQYSNAKIVLRAHNVEHEIWQRASKQPNPIFKRFYLQLLASRIKNLEVSTINKYDLLVPITGRDANILNQLGNQKPFCTTPFGIDTSHLKPPSGKIDFPSLFFIGTLDWLPNQEGIVWFLDNVWQEIGTMHSNLKLYIAGRNAPNWMMKKFNKKNVVYLGEIEDAYEFMNKYAIMVVPLFSGSGIRVKIIEGMALGKTIITTGIGAEGIDATSETNILIENDAQGFINQINRLLCNKSAFDQIGENASIFANKYFDNSRITSHLISFYKNHMEA